MGLDPVSWAVLGAAAIGGSASVYSGRQASKGARAAAEAQQKGYSAAQREQARQFDVMRQILAPYISAGRPDLTQPYIAAGPGAIQQMQRLVGLGGEGARQQALLNVYKQPEYTQLSDITDKNIKEYERNRERELAALKKSTEYRNPTLAEGQKGKTAIKQAREDLIAKFQLATDKGIRDIETEGYNQQQALFKPILEDKQYEQMGMEQQRQAIQQIEQGPLFQELARQGEAALLANASATGRRGAEDTQSALARYRPQLLNQLIDQTYARLGGLTNVGQTAAQNLLNVGQASAAGVGAGALQSGNAMANLMVGQAGAQAAGIQGAAAGQAAGISGFGNAISGGLQNYALLNTLGSGGGGLGTGGFYKTAAEATAAGGGAPVAYFGGDSPSAARGYYIQS
jgi:hypothetical protein